MIMLCTVSNPHVHHCLHQRRLDCGVAAGKEKDERQQFSARLGWAARPKDRKQSFSDIGRNRIIIMENNEHYLDALAQVITWLKKRAIE